MHLRWNRELHSGKACEVRRLSSKVETICGDLRPANIRSGQIPPHSSPELRLDGLYRVTVAWVIDPMEAELLG